ncbi:MAG: cytochrome P450 [Pseudomonadales bacterium]|nr:cytochrome P450 [Pseudomonadales bacterium]
MAIPTAPIEIIDADYYQENGYPFHIWDKLRKDAPVAYCEHPNLVPFYAISRYEDIVEISRQPTLFESAPLLVVQPPDMAMQQQIRSIINMDLPDHRTYRKIMSSYFTKKRLNESQPKMDRVAEQILDAVAAKGDEVDFVNEVSKILPLAVIAEQLGLPVEDRDQFFQWTNEVVGALDPDFAREDGTKGPELALKAIQEVFVYCTKFVEDRRKSPQDDLTTVLANAKIDGEYLPPLELLSYIFILIIAGNETTRNATSGGMMTLMEHPDQMQYAIKHPEVLDSMVEEMVRWSSPIIHFCRTPNKDVTLHGVDIKAGEHIAMFYPSANRDETRFDDPYRFDILRTPNQHLGYGIGEHLCLGAHLARLELRAIFKGILHRVNHVELIGEPNRLKSSLIGGIKSLPVKIDFAA